MDYLIPALGAAIIIIVLVLFVRTLFKQANDLYGTFTDEKNKIHPISSLKNKKRAVDPERSVERDKRE